MPMHHLHLSMHFSISHTLGRQAAAALRSPLPIKMDAQRLVLLGVCIAQHHRSFHDACISHAEQS